MMMPDVNVLVYAWDGDAPKHEVAAAWLNEALTADEPLGLSMLVAAGAMRVLSHPRILARPMPRELVMDNCQRMLDPGRAVLIGPGPGHWDIFCRLCREVDARGSLISDVQHAAIAIENDATLVSFDHGFARFHGLSWQRLR